MGGTGSGKWTRSDTRETTDYRFQIEVGKLKADIQSGVDTPGVITAYGQSLSYVVMDGYLVLGVDPALDSVTITGGVNILGLAQTPCNFGGYRNWLNCPVCKRRVRIIYLHSKRLACRSCCNLTYSSQRDSKLVRLITRTQKARCALGGTGSLGEPIPAKPKGMHWRTYWLGLQKITRESKAMNKEFDVEFPLLDIFKKKADDT